MKPKTDSLIIGNAGGMIRKKFLELIPAMLMANLSAFVIIQVDGVVVGNLVSEEALSAVTLFQPVYYFVCALTAIVGGSQFLVSSAIGKNNDYTLKAALKSSMAVTVIAMVVIGVLEVPATGLLIGGYENSSLIYEYAVPFFFTYLLSCVSVWGTYLFVSFGKTKLLFVLSIVESSANVVFDLLFVGLLDMGLSGAAIGTLLANVVRVILTLRYAGKIINFREIISLKTQKSDLKHNIKDIIIYSLPVVSTNIMISVQGRFMNELFLHFYGTEGIILLTVNRLIFNMATLCYGAIVTAGSGITGIFKGALEYERYEQCIRSLIKIVVCVGLFFMIVAIVGYKVFFRICGVDNIPEVALLATALFSVVYIPRGINSAIRTYFTYEKKTRIMTVLVILQMAVLPLAFALTICNFIPILIFVSFGFSDLTVLVISVLYVRRMKHGQAKESESQLRLILSIKEENAVQASAYVTEYLKEHGIDDKVSFKASLCVEEMTAYLPEKKGRNTEILLLIYIEDDNLVFHMVYDGDNLHLDSLEDTPVFNVIYDNYELVHALASDFAYQHVMNLSNITIRFKMDGQNAELHNTIE